MVQTKRKFLYAIETTGSRGCVESFGSVGCSLNRAGRIQLSALCCDAGSLITYMPIKSVHVTHLVWLFQCISFSLPFLHCM
jgi:hypothetical protein